jgi:hypothetical protein
MQASFETDPFFAQARLGAIVNHCGATENRDEYDQTEAFLKRHAESLPSHVFQLRSQAA